MRTLIESIPFAAPSLEMYGVSEAFKVPSKLLRDRLPLAGTRKRSVTLMIVDDGYDFTIPSMAWDGGSKRIVRVMQASPTGWRVFPVPNEHLPSGWPTFKLGEPYILGPKQVVQETGTFRGKDAGVTLMVPKSVALELGVIYKPFDPEGLSDWDEHNRRLDFEDDERWG